MHAARAGARIGRSRRPSPSKVAITPLTRILPPNAACLEDEQGEFIGFLERLRQAKDKAEFDQFMAERRQYSGGPSAAPQQQ